MVKKKKHIQKKQKLYTFFSQKPRSYFLFLFCIIIVGVCSIFLYQSITQMNNQKVEGVSTNTMLPIPPNTFTTVLVEPNHVLKTIPSRYAGLSFEMSNICQILSWDQSSNTFSQLLKNLGQSVIRIGGNTADRTLWDEQGTLQCSANKTVLTQQSITSLFSFAQKIGWKIIWTLNLANYAPTTYSKEADAVIKMGGSNLFALGIGNEPDLYPQNGIRSSSYTFNDYLSQWNIYKKAILSIHPKAHLMGNDNCCHEPWLTSFITNQSSSVTLITQHDYPTSNTSTDPGRIPTIDNLLSSLLMQKTASAIDSWVKIANTARLPLAIDEANSTSGGGKAGVSDTFASTLWGIDYLFTALQHGVSHVNFHTGISPSLYSPIDKNGNPTALYYSLLFFHYAASSGNLVHTNIQSSYNVTAYSVIGSDGKLRIVLINKDLVHANATIQITLTKAYKKATALFLQAPSVTATKGITFGGSSIAADGTWNPSNVQNILVNGTHISITMPQISAVVVIVE